MEKVSDLLANMIGLVAPKSRTHVPQSALRRVRDEREVGQYSDTSSGRAKSRAHLGASRRSEPTATASGSKTPSVSSASVL